MISYLSNRTEVEVKQQFASWAKHPAGVMLRINWQCPISAGRKLQAASLTAGEGYYRMDLERINYDTTRHRPKSFPATENS